MSTQLVLVTSYLNLRIQQDLLNQFNNTIIIRPSVMLLATALGLFIKPMGRFQSPHLFPTLLLIVCSLPNHHVPLLMALHIQMGFPTLEFLPTCHFEPTWLLSSCAKVHPTTIAQA
jgi:hypothetical protein